MLISVVVPVYKVEEYLDRCVESILSQTFRDFDLILVDDGSPDNCGKMCDEYAEKDSRIHVIHKENGGLSDARNAGIEWCFENSDSKWITFIDSDDWIHPMYLETLVNAINDTGCSVSVCKFLQTDNDNEIYDRNVKKAVAFNTEDFYCNHHLNAVIAWGKLYKKNCFESIRYPVGKLHEDEFTTYKIIFQFETIAYVDSELYFYYYNNDSITKSEWNPKRLNALEGIELQYEFFKKNSYKKAYDCCIITYYDALLTHLKFAGRLPEYRNSYIFLRKKLRKAIIKFRGYKGFLFSDNKPMYEIAFPKLMIIYWKFVSIKNRLKK